MKRAGDLSAHPEPADVGKSGIFGPRSAATAVDDRIRMRNPDRKRRVALAEGQ